MELEGLKEAERGGVVAAVVLLLLLRVGTCSSVQRWSGAAAYVSLSNADRSAASLLTARREHQAEREMAQGGGDHLD